MLQHAGQPISQFTNSGLSRFGPVEGRGEPRPAVEDEPPVLDLVGAGRPRTWSGRVGVGLRPARFRQEAVEGPFPSRLAGDLQRRIQWEACRANSPPAPGLPVRSIPAIPWGVFHSRAAPVRLSAARGWFPQLSASPSRTVCACGGLCCLPKVLPLPNTACETKQPRCPRGDGQEEQPLPAVRSADFLRREETRRNAVASPFEISPDGAEAENKVAWDILEEAEMRLIRINRRNQGRP